jgi:hypothetical protein
MSESKEVLVELTRIASEHDGLLMPADIVKAARVKSSPLHSRFEWDDTAAAERYRLWQARQLIDVTVEYIGTGRDAVMSRVFVSLTTDRSAGGGYRAIHAVLANTEHRERLLEDAKIEMNRFRKKYSELKELADVFAAMDRVNVPRSTASASHSAQL